MMKRLFLALISLLFVGTGLLNAQYRTTLQDLDDSETVRALKEHVATLSAAQLEGRKAGSEGEKMAAEYLEARLREFGIDILQSRIDLAELTVLCVITCRNGGIGLDCAFYAHKRVCTFRH